jgi:hypothetical protein
VGASPHIDEDKKQSSWEQLRGVYKVMGRLWALLSILGMVMAIVAVYLWQVVSAVHPAPPCGLGLPAMGSNPATRQPQQLLSLLACTCAGLHSILFFLLAAVAAALA